MAGIKPPTNFHSAPLSQSQPYGLADRTQLHSPLFPPKYLQISITNLYGVTYIYQHVRRHTRIQTPSHLNSNFRLLSTLPSSQRHRRLIYYVHPFYCPYKVQSLPKFHSHHFRPTIFQHVKDQVRLEPNLQRHPTPYSSHSLTSIKSSRLPERRIVVLTMFQKDPTISKNRQFSPWNRPLRHRRGIEVQLHPS
jgi:hypothetical protein